MYKSVKFSPVENAKTEEKIFNFVTTHFQCRCSTLRIGDSLYVQPDDDSKIDQIIEFNFAKELIFQESNISVDPEMKSIKELAPQPAEVEKKAEVGLGLQSLKPAPEIKPPVGPQEEDKVSPPVVPSQKLAEHPPIHLEPESGDFDTRVMKALQDTPLSSRAAAPDDFFLAYSSTTICIPIFILYLLVIVLTKTVGALFNNL